MKFLVIVESPGKISTVSKYLNSSKYAKQNGTQYVVKASGGHLMNLHPKNLSVDVDNGFTPTYVWATDAFHKKMMKEIKDTAKQCDNRVLIASDMDLEGENIGYTICKLLGLNMENTPRLMFRAITQPDLEKALANPGRLDEKQLDAQKTRRILDRLIGWTLSPMACKYIGQNMSVGRVQSIMTKLVVEREIELEKFESKLEYRASGLFSKTVIDENDNNFLVVRTPWIYKTLATDYLKQCSKSTFTVKSKEEKEELRQPSPPFITSTLQTEICRKFGISAKQVMSIAQQLYERGVISYPRTDSVKLPPNMLGQIGKIVKEKYGEEYHKARQFNNKGKNAQEAHACIYPTNPTMFDYQGEENTLLSKVYRIIHRRCIASQMAPCKVNVVTVLVNQTVTDIKSITEIKSVEWYGKSEEIVFDGWKRTYNFETQTDYKSTSDVTKEEEDKQMNKNNFTNWTPDTEVKYKEITMKEKYTVPTCARYNDSSLVAKMKTLGVGRPSTYGTILEAVEKRGYIQKVTQKGTVKECSIWTLSCPGDDITIKKWKQTVNEIKKKYVPTDVGRKLTVFIDEHFTTMFDYGYTSEIEKHLDGIESGAVNWTNILRNEYDIMTETIKKIKSSGGVHNATKTFDALDGKRYLGQLPEPDNRYAYTFHGRYGPCVWVLTQQELQDIRDNKKVKGAYIKITKTPETVTLEDIVEESKYPRTLGVLEDGTTVTLNKGRYGIYLKVDEKNVSLKDTVNTNDFEAVKAYISGGNTNSASRASLKTVVNPANNKQKIDVYNGQYGPYFKWQDKFISVKEDMLEELDWTTAMDLAEKKLKQKPFVKKNFNNFKKKNNNYDD